MSKIIEMDGPEQAFFEPLYGERVCYRTLAWAGTDPHTLVRKMDEAQQTIRGSLGSGIIYWRAKPALSQSLETEDFVCSCRLATYPELSNSVWESVV